MVWTKFRWCEPKFQECEWNLDGVNKIMTVWSSKLRVWTKFRWCELKFQECEQHVNGVNKIMTVWSWELMVWTKFWRCDQMLMLWWNDISVWTNVHFLEIVWCQLCNLCCISESRQLECLQNFRKSYYTIIINNLGCWIIKD